MQTEAEQVGFADARISEVLRRIANEKGNYIHFSLTTLSITVWTHQMVQQFANIVHFQNNGRHGNEKFGSLMGALKLVRTNWFHMTLTLIISTTFASSNKQPSPMSFN